MPGNTDNPLKARLKKWYHSGKDIKRLLYPKPLSIETCYLQLAIIKEKELKQNPVDDFEKTTDLDRHYWLREYERIENIQEKIELEAIFSSCEGSPRRIYIEGAAGAGKSTLAHRLVYEWSKNSEFLKDYDWVFYIRLRDLAAKKYPDQLDSLIAILDAQLFLDCGEKFKISEKQALLNTLRKKLEEESSDKILWILDGYDEFSREVERYSCWENLIGSECDFLITSRPGHSYRLPWSTQNISKLAVLGFSDEQIEKYIAHFFNPKVTPKIDSTQQVPFLKYIKNDLNLWSLAHTPIQLELLCSVWNKGLKQQESITLTSLYSLIVDALLKYPESKFPKIDISRLSTNDLKEDYEANLCCLEQLAYLGMQRGEILFSETLIEESYLSLKNKLNLVNKNNFIENLTTLGIFKYYDHSGNGEFAHLTFQEYFAARHVEKILVQFIEDNNVLDREFESFFKDNKFDPKSQVVWWFVAGLLSSVNPNEENQQQSKMQKLQAFFDLFLQEPRKKIEVFELPLLAKCLVEAGTPEIKQKEEIKTHFKNWINFYFQEDVLALKIDGFKNLFNIVKSSYELVIWIKPMLLVSLQSEDEEVCGPVIDVLVELGSLLDIDLVKAIEDCLLRLLESPRLEVVYQQLHIFTLIRTLDEVATPILKNKRDIYFLSILDKILDTEEKKLTFILRDFTLGMRDPSSGAQIIHQNTSDFAKIFFGIVKEIHALGSKVSSDLQTKTKRCLLKLMKSNSLRLGGETLRAFDLIGEFESISNQARKDRIQYVLELLVDKKIPDRTEIGAYIITSADVAQIACSLLIVDEDRKLKVKTEQYLLDMLKHTSLWRRCDGIEAIMLLGMQVPLTLKKLVDECLQQCLNEIIVQKKIIEELESSASNFVTSANRVYFYLRKRYEISCDILAKALCGFPGIELAHHHIWLSEFLQAKYGVIACTVIEVISSSNIFPLFNEKINECLLGLLKNKNNSIPWDAALKLVSTLALTLNQNLKDELLNLLQDDTLEARQSISLTTTIRMLGVAANPELQQSRKMRLLHLLKSKEESIYDVVQELTKTPEGLENFFEAVFETDFANIPLSVIEKRLLQERIIASDELNSLQPNQQGASLMPDPKKVSTVEGQVILFNQNIDNVIVALRQQIAEVVARPTEFGLQANGLSVALIKAQQEQKADSELVSDIKKISIKTLSLSLDEVFSNGNNILNGFNVLHWGMALNRAETIQYLLSKGFDEQLTQRNSMGLTPMQMAVIAGSQACFLSRFSNIPEFSDIEIRYVNEQNEKLQFKLNELHLALISQQVPIVRDIFATLKNHHKAIGTEIKGIGNLLHLLVYIGNSQAQLEPVSIEVESSENSGADLKVNVVDLLQLILQQGFSKEILIKLLTESENNCEGYSPLSLAAKYGQIGLLHALINYLKLHVEASNGLEEVIKAFYVAAQHGQNEVVDYLINFHQFKPSNTHTDYNATIKILAEKAPTESHYRLIQGLIRNTEKETKHTKNNKPATNKQLYENLVLSGGGGKGFIYPYALQALEICLQKRSKSVSNKFVAQSLGMNTIVRVGGTSAGAMFAFALALGYTSQVLESKLATNFAEFLESDHIEKVTQQLQAKNPNNDQILTSILSQLNLQVARLRDLIGEAKESAHPILKSTFEFIKHPRAIYSEVVEAIKKLKELDQQFSGFSQGEKAYAFLKQLLLDKKLPEDLTFGELAQRISQDTKKQAGYKHLHMVVTNLTKSSFEVLSTENPLYTKYVVLDAVLASMSYPLVFMPHRLKIKEGNQIKTLADEYIDGGALRNYPIDEFDFKQYTDTDHTGDPKYPELNKKTLGFRFADHPSTAQSQQPKAETVLSRLKEFASLYSQAETLIGAHLDRDYHRSIVLDTGAITTFTFKQLTDEEKRFLKQQADLAVGEYFHTTLHQGETIVLGSSQNFFSSATASSSQAQSSPVSAATMSGASSSHSGMTPSSF